VAKLYSYWIVVNYREAYNLFACNGILFNHESPRRGETFVTRKITRGISRIKYGLNDKIYLGNIYSKRDWGYAPDYIEAMWMMLQEEKPDDFVIATNETHTVKEFIEESCKFAQIDFEWKGSGLDEKCVMKETNKVIVEIDPRYYRPTEVAFLLGDYAKANEKLCWKPKVKFADLIHIMMEADLELARYEKHKASFKKDKF
jgi:GDPmannose 4,6-dehydratase